MKLSEIMTKPVVRVRADDSVRTAARLLAQHRITSMPVIDSSNNVVGIVSELDLLRDRIPHDPRAHLTRYDEPPTAPGKLVRDVMSDTVFCLSENADAADAVELMVTTRVRAVPILSGPDLVGIVSRRDVLRTLLRDDDAVRAEVQACLDDYTTADEECQVEVDAGEVTIVEHFNDAERRRAAVALVETVPGVVRVRTRR